ncbi:MAG: alginate export family protein [Stagnimonas sp.]|nr:alginate export family protein [Stagnimonas sp.]
MNRLTLALAATAFCGLSSAASLPDALLQGTPTLDLRLRYESVEQGNLASDAHATTLRGALGYTTKPWQGFDARAELEGVIAANSDLYNSTGNGIGNRPVVADPETLGFNQAWLRYTLPNKISLTAGRQRLSFDNARFIGTVGWRQDEQTYDGALLVAPLGKDFVAQLAHIGNVNSFRRFGPNLIAACAVSGPCSADLSLNGQALNLAYSSSPKLKLVGYSYWLDFTANTAARRDTRTLGVRATGRWPMTAGKEALSLDYTLEAAEQQRYGDSPQSVDAEYRLAELGLSQGVFNGKLGYEVLGGDGIYGFQTPLASLHAFQGWADVFLATPAMGIRDAYVQVGGTLAKTALQASYHDYKADSRNLDYGKEINVQATRPLVPLFGKPLTLGLKAAFYEAEGFPVAAGKPYDTTKLWAWLQYKL